MPSNAGNHEMFSQMQNPLSNLKVSMVGEWEKFNRVLKYLGGGSFNRGIKRDIAKAQRDFLTRYKKSLAVALATSGSSVGVSFADHSRNYHSPTKVIGVRSGVYLAALRNLRITADNYQVSLSYNRGDLNRKSHKYGTNLGQYAIYFEVGTSKQPARPLWESTFVHMGGSQRVMKDIVGAVGRRFNDMGVNIKTDAT